MLSLVLPFWLSLGFFAGQFLSQYMLFLLARLIGFLG